MWQKHSVRLEQKPQSIVTMKFMLNGSVILLTKYESET
jgi:hypothetical protein